MYVSVYMCTCMAYRHYGATHVGCSTCLSSRKHDGSQRVSSYFSGCWEGRMVMRIGLSPVNVNVRRQLIQLCHWLWLFPMTHLSFQDNWHFWRAPFLLSFISLYQRSHFSFSALGRPFFTHKVLSVYFFVALFSLRVCRQPHTLSTNASLKIKPPKYQWQFIFRNILLGPWPASWDVCVWIGSDLDERDRQTYRKRQVGRQTDG